MAVLTGVSADVARRATALRYSRTVWDRFILSDRPPWFSEHRAIPGSYRHSQPLQRFCPECCEENFYLRRVWNLGFVTCCVVHNRLLLERCQRCALDLDFGGERRAKDAVGGVLVWTPCPGCGLRWEQTDAYPPGCTPEPGFLDFIRRLANLAENEGASPVCLEAGREAFRALDQLLRLVRHPLYFGQSRGYNEEARARRLEIFKVQPRLAVNTSPVDLSRAKIGFLDQTPEARHAFLRLAFWLIRAGVQQDSKRAVLDLNSLPGIRQPALATLHSLVVSD